MNQRRVHFTILLLIAILLFPVEQNVFALKFTNTLLTENRDQFSKNIIENIVFENIEIKQYRSNTEDNSDTHDIKESFNQTPINQDVLGSFLFYNDFILNTLRIKSKYGLVGSGNHYFDVISAAGDTIINAGRIVINSDGSYRLYKTNFVGRIIPISYFATDINGNSIEGGLTIDMLPTVNQFDQAQNNKPIARDDKVQIKKNVSVEANVLNNDNDPDCDLMLITKIEITN